MKQYRKGGPLSPPFPGTGSVKAQNKDTSAAYTETLRFYHRYRSTFTFNIHGCQFYSTANYVKSKLFFIQEKLIIGNISCQ